MESEKKKKRSIFQSFLGVLLAIPVLVVVVPLLMSSDAAFSGLAEKFCENIRDIRHFFRILVPLS